MNKYTEAIQGDDVVILCDGIPMGVGEILAALNAATPPADAALADARAQKPVAYMHNKRADVIHTSVKSLLSDFAVNSGPESMLRPIDKSEHYTIPLYAAPVPAQPAAVPEAVEKDAARYRWLRRKVCIIQRSGFMGTFSDRYADFEFINVPMPTYMAPDAAVELDASIDREITEEKYNELAAD